MSNTQLIIPEWQFLDANGSPYAGGQVFTYTPGTTTRKDTFLDPNGAAANSFPIVLDAAGRCIVFGNGDYRVIVKDAAGNLIYDQLSSSFLASSVISAVMLPVVGAATLAEARRLLGVDDAIQTAVTNIQLMPGPAGAQGIQGIQGVKGDKGDKGDTGSTGSVDTTSGNFMYAQTGTGMSDDFGNFTVTYPHPFAAPPTQFTLVASSDPRIYYQPGQAGNFLFSSSVLVDRAFGGTVALFVEDGNVHAMANVHFDYTVVGY